MKSHFLYTKHANSSIHYFVLFVHEFYEIIRLNFRATVRPATEPMEEKSSENKITTPAPLNEESLQLHSIISDVSVISDPRLLIPVKKDLKQVKVETSEKAEEMAEDPQEQ